jgi:type I restriction enzyme S subunit
MKAGWTMQVFDDVLDIRNGKNQREVESPEGEYPIFGSAGNVMGYATSFICEAGTTIIGRKGNINTPILSTSNFWNVDTAFGLAAKTGLNNKFLYYYCLSFDFSVLNRGTTIPSLVKSELLKISIPVPPLPEQQRIVAILGEAFEGIATATANAEKNLASARGLFESHLQSVFSQCGEGWVKNKLKALTTKIGSGATPRGGEESYKSEGISLIRSLNVHDFGFRYRKLAFLDDAQANELSNVEVQPNDVLLNITGASVARCCLVPEDVLPARVNQHVSIIRPITNKLDASFLHYLLISKTYKNQLLQTGSEGGSTRQAITKAQIQDFSIDYPATLVEQQSIVAKLDTMLIETQCLESIYKQKLTALTELKKSILNQAFSGQLH